MKASILTAFILSLFYYSCDNSSTKEEVTTEPVVQQAIPIQEVPTEIAPVQNTSDASTNVLLGTWVGEMSNKKLTIVIEEVKEGTLVGYNILGDNKRGLKGTFSDGDWDQPCSKAYSAVLNEPGDDKWDGVFSIKFVGYEEEEELEDGPECMGNLQGVEAMGEWTMNGKKDPKTFSLIKQK